MILLFNHTLSEIQKQDAKESLGVREFITLPPDVLKVWSHVPADIPEIEGHLQPVKQFVKKHAVKGEFILIQGDFGATYSMIGFAKRLGLIPVYATTLREVAEQTVNDTVVKKSIFTHKIFRRY